MADNKTKDKTLSVSSGKTLTLKRPIDQGTVRQSFSHGRTKSVVVEKVKRRQGGGVRTEERSEITPVQLKSTGAAAGAKGRAAGPRGQSANPRANKPSTPSKADNAGLVLRELTDSERDARMAALNEALAREEEERRQAEIERKKSIERNKKEAKEKAEAEERRLEEEARREKEEKIRAVRYSAEEATPPVEELDKDKSAKSKVANKTSARQKNEDDDDNERRKSGSGKATLKLAPAPKPTKGAPSGGRRTGRLTVQNALSGDGEERMRSVASYRRRMQRLTGQRDAEPKEKVQRAVTIPETITVQELANRMAERAVDVIKLMMKQGQMVKITDVLDADTAQLIVEEMGHTVNRVAASDVEEGLFDESDTEEALKPRAPIVTIMGHVDHGKTSLLDAFRSTNVVTGEAGGITQHIGAYQVTAPNGGKISFIDTPGHAAFTSMRARGAKVTDIVILVVAADDGVMPQTIEAISHAKAAEVPIIVAVNKIDKPEANPQKVKSELLQHEVFVESMGGEVLEVEVSAKEKTNLNALLEAIELQSELLDIRANPDRSAEGAVIEARLDRGRGPVATVLVQRGTLKTGDLVIAGAAWGKVRALLNDHGQQVKEVGPSTPVEILGFNAAPDAGDRMAVVDSEARAREITAYRQQLHKEKQAAKASGSRGSLEQMMSSLAEEGKKRFPLIIKGDVQGSVEAISVALEKMGTDEVEAQILHTGVGGISESDVTLAEASNAAIIGFNVRAHKEARDAAEKAGIEIRYYNIIYDLIDDVKAAMSGLLDPTLRETMLGNAEVLEIFDISKLGKIAGCRVTDGNVERGAHVRLIRDSVVIHEGKLSTLRRFKDNVNSVSAGQECGMSFENYHDMRPGDVIECYNVEEVARTL